MNNHAIRKFSIGFMVAFSALTIIALIVISLFTLWGSGPVPVAYVITNVTNNDQEIIKDCGTVQLTVLQNITTDEISYQCGNLGKISEIVTLYE